MLNQKGRAFLIRSYEAGIYGFSGLGRRDRYAARSGISPDGPARVVIFSIAMDFKSRDAEEQTVDYAHIRARAEIHWSGERWLCVAIGTEAIV